MERQTTDPAMGNLNYNRNDLDFYPTPEWVTEAIIPSLREYLPSKAVIWEPACGLGHMSEVLISYGWRVVSSDIINRGYHRQDFSANFLASTISTTIAFDAIVTNPPYGKLLDPFIAKSLELTEKNKGVVALLMRNEVDSASSRSKFFELHPAFSEKFVLLKRPRWIEYKPGDAGPRHNYSWYIWDWKNTDLPCIRYGK